MNDANIDHKIEKYTYKLKNSKSRRDMYTYQKKVKHYKMLKMSGGTMVDNKNITRAIEFIEELKKSQVKNAKDVETIMQKIDEFRKACLSEKPVVLAPPPPGPPPTKTPLSPTPPPTRPTPSPLPKK